MRLFHPQVSPAHRAGHPRRTARPAGDGWPAVARSRLGSRVRGYALEIEDAWVFPEIIEIHPGDRRNTHADIVAGMHALIAAHWNAFGAEPLVLLEHHKDQSISTGSQMRSFWAVLRIFIRIAGWRDSARPLALHAATERVPRSLGEVPLDALQAFHIITISALRRSPTVALAAGSR